MRSIISEKPYCYLCGSTDRVERHHIFPSGLREKSDKYGLIIPLCWEHHQGKNGVHANRELMDEVKRIGQMAFEEIHGHDKFMREFHRNYLDDMPNSPKTEELNL